MATTNVEPNRLGVGLYSIPEAARLAKIHVQQVRRWIRPTEGLIPGVFLPEDQAITFLELMELHFIKMFRDQGVSLQTIRRAASTAAKKFKTPLPFTVHHFDTDGHTIFATLIDKEKETSHVEDLKHGQYVFDEIIRPFFKKLEYGQNELLRFWPLTPTGHIVLDPERRFGKPIDAKTGVPTEALFHAVEAGEDVRTVADWFNVSVAAVTAAVEFEKSLAA